jgi:branched-chain amino acid transport system permease protein
VKDIVFAVILGIGIGGLYAMLATGLVTAFKGSGVINFAHGAFAMYTVYVYDELTKNGDLVFPWVDIIPGHSPNLPVTVSLGDQMARFPAAVLALLMACFIGLLAHLLVFRPLRNAPALGKVIGAVGIMLYLQSIASINFGAEARQNPGFLPGTSGDNTFFANFLDFGKNLPHIVVWMASCALVMGAVVWAILTFTRFGLATRAADENEKGASLIGYSPQLLAGINWVFSALLAGITGLIVIGLGSLQVDRFTLYVVPALAAALVGNLTSIPLAVAGGFLIGMFQSGMVEVADQSWWPAWLPANGMRELVPLLAIVLVLFFRGARLPVRGSIIQRRQPLALATKRAWVGVVVGIVLVALLSNIFTAEWEVALTTSLTAGMIMLSSVVLVGFLGQISLAQTALAGIAAYTAIRFSSNGTLGPFDLVAVDGPGLPAPIAFVIGVAAAVIVGLLVGLPALRIRGVQLAIVTIAAVGPIGNLLLQNQSLFSTAAEASMPVPKPRWFGVYLSATDPNTARTDFWRFTAFAVIAFVLVGLAVVNLRRGATGRRFLAVRANERAAAAAGIDVARTKMLGFAIASALAGIGGIFQAYKLGAVQVESYSLFAGLAILAFAYLGGITSVWGAIIGGLMIGGGLVSQTIGNFADADFNAYLSVIGAIGLILTAILNPEGIATGTSLTVKHLWAKARGRQAPVPAPPAPAPSEPTSPATVAP